MADFAGADGELRELALFAGAGGGMLGGKLLGWRTVCAVEYEPYPACVLAQRQNDGLLPPFPIWDDVRTFDGKPWRGIVDGVSGGFPCQAYSAAAAGKNTADDLWPEMRRIVADVAPRLVFAENVSRRAIERSAIDLTAMGYKAKAISLSAKDLGADHVRKRYWIRAYANDESELFSEVYAEMAVSKSICDGVWETNPGKSRVANGVPARVDRLKAIGNGQVPQCAAAAWIILTEQQVKK